MGSVVRVDFSYKRREQANRECAEAIRQVIESALIESGVCARKSSIIAAIVGNHARTQLHALVAAAPAFVSIDTTSATPIDDQVREQIGALVDRMVNASMEAMVRFAVASSASITVAYE